jgi:hypothetical protein
MSENKTRPTELSVEQYLGKIDDDLRRKDCAVLVKMMSKATKLKPKMWGTAIVGYQYKYASGREGETCLVGFSSRKGDISIYGTGNVPGQEELLSRLGKHKIGKGCLYIGRLNDVDILVLEQLISASVKARAD